MHVPMYGQIWKVLISASSTTQAFDKKSEYIPFRALFALICRRGTEGQREGGEGGEGGEGSLARERYGGEKGNFF